jgi:hypothetical protein
MWRFLERWRCGEAGSSIGLGGAWCPTIREQFRLHYSRIRPTCHFYCLNLYQPCSALFQVVASSYNRFTLPPPCLPPLPTERSKPNIKMDNMSMNSYHVPNSLNILAGIFLTLGAVCGLIVLGDIIWRRGWRSMMWIM